MEIQSRASRPTLGMRNGFTTRVARMHAPHKRRVRAMGNREHYFRNKEAIRNRRNEKARAEKRKKDWTTPEYRARNLLRKAVFRGKIKKPTACEMCGASGGIIHGHHEDYGKPLDVQWLCTVCHGRVHSRDYQEAGKP